MDPACILDVPESASLEKTLVMVVPKAWDSFDSGIEVNGNNFTAVLSFETGPIQNCGARGSERG